MSLQGRSPELRSGSERGRFSGLGRMAIALVALVALIGVALQAKAAYLTGPSASAAGASSAQGAARMSTAPDSGPIVIHEEKHDLSPRFDSIPPAAPIAKPQEEREQGHHVVYKTGVHDIDNVVQSSFGPLAI